MAHVPDSDQRKLDVGDRIWFCDYMFDRDRTTVTTRSAVILRCTPTFIWWKGNSYSTTKVRREDVHVSEEAALHAARIEAGQQLISEQEHAEQMKAFRRRQIAACDRALEELRA